MRYFTPTFQIATLAPPQSHLRSKIGGVPWGLPLHLWPTCCGQLQKLVAQLLHKPPVLDLGNPNAVIHIFQCQVCLGISDGDKGRAAFFLDRHLLGNQPSTPEGYDAPSEMGRPLLAEAFIESWDEHDDGIPDSRLPEFFNEQKLWALYDEFPKVPWFSSNSARFGGSPRWTGNGPLQFMGDEPLLAPPFELLFQLDEFIDMPGKAPAADDVGCRVFIHKKGQLDKVLDPAPGNERLNAPFYVYSEEDGHYSFEFINIGSDGTLFVFINRTTTPHQVRWFWNR